MGKSKQNKQPKKDGNHRAETKEERQERLRQQEEARQACFKILPYAGGVIVLFLALFAFYVRSVPPKVPKPKMTPAPGGLGDVERILAQGGSFAAKDTATDSAGEEVPPAEAPPAEDEPASEPEDPEERVEL